MMSTKMSMPLRKVVSLRNSLWSWRRIGWWFMGENPMAGIPTCQHKKHKFQFLLLDKSTHLSEIPRVGSCREYLWLDNEFVFGKCSRDGAPPGIISGHRGHGLVSELLDKLYLKVFPCFCHPTSQASLELFIYKKVMDPFLVLKEFYSLKWKYIYQPYLW